MTTTPNTTITPDQDMRNTWDLPAEQAQAAADYAAAMGVEDAFVPFFLPGKTYGIWTVGQTIVIDSVVFTDAIVPDDTRADIQASNYGKNLAQQSDTGGTWGYFWVRVGANHTQTTPAFEMLG